MKVKTVKMIDVSDWDDLVTKTYGRPYSFQQQDGCKGRGVEHIEVPSSWNEDDDMHDSIREVVNGSEMGVKFATWLARDPKAPLADERDGRGTDQWMIDMFWDRNFYPDVNMVINDLHDKGLLEAGEYSIDIDW